MSLSPSTASSQPAPTEPVSLLCKLMLLPLLSSSHPPLPREAEPLLLALVIDGSLAVATRAGHLLQRAVAPCLAPLTSSIQLPATRTQLPVSARLQHSTPWRLQLLGTARASPGCSLPMRIPGAGLGCSLPMCIPEAMCTLVQGVQPRSSPCRCLEDPEPYCCPALHIIHHQKAAKQFWWPIF